VAYYKNVTKRLEQARKDVNRVGIDTLMPLAAALSVDVEALVERVTYRAYLSVD